MYIKLLNRYLHLLHLYKTVSLLPVMSLIGSSASIPFGNDSIEAVK